MLAHEERQPFQLAIWLLQSLLTGRRARSTIAVWRRRDRRGRWRFRERWTCGGGQRSGSCATWLLSAMGTAKLTKLSWRASLTVLQSLCKKKNAWGTYKNALELGFAIWRRGLLGKSSVTGSQSVALVGSLTAWSTCFKHTLVKLWEKTRETCNAWPRQLGPPSFTRLCMTTRLISIASAHKVRTVGVAGSYSSLVGLITLQQTYCHQHFLEVIKPIWAQLTDKGLLEKCVCGATQNRNEAWNGMLWGICPKTKFCGTSVVKLCAALTCLRFNNGLGPYCEVLEAMGIERGAFTASGLAEQDRKRVDAASNKTTEGCKKARKRRRRVRKG